MSILRPHSVEQNMTVQLPPEVQQYLAKNALGLFGRTFGKQSWLMLIAAALGVWAYFRFQSGSVEEGTVAGVLAAIFQWLQMKLGVDKSGLTWSALFSKENREKLYEFATREEVQAFILPRLPDELQTALRQHLKHPKPMNTAPTAPEGKGPLATILATPKLAPLPRPGEEPQQSFPSAFTVEETDGPVAEGTQIVEESQPLAPARTRPLTLPKSQETLLTSPLSEALAESILPAYGVDDQVIVTPLVKEFSAAVGGLFAGRVVAVSKTMVILELLDGSEKCVTLSNHLIWKPV